MSKLLIFLVGLLLLSASAFAQQYHDAQTGYESLENITERHQAERKALKEKQNAERLEIRLLHQKEMESLLEKHKLERRSAVYRGY